MIGMGLDGVGAPHKIGRRFLGGDDGGGVGGGGGIGGASELVGEIGVVGGGAEEWWEPFSTESHDSSCSSGHDHHTINSIP